MAYKGGRVKWGSLCTRPVGAPPRQPANSKQILKVIRVASNCPHAARARLKALLGPLKIMKVAAERRLGAHMARPLANAAKQATPVPAHESACKECCLKQADRAFLGWEAPLCAVPRVVANRLTRSRPAAPPPQATGGRKARRATGEDTCP